MPHSPDVDGFSELVGRFQPEPTPGLPHDTAEIWDALIYPAFLGENVKSSQAAFLSDLLRPHLDYAHRAVAARDPDWSRRIIADIDVARRSVPAGAPGSGLKRVALASAEKLLRGGDLAEMIATADSCFAAHRIGPALMARIAGDRNRQMDLVATVTDEIHYFGPTKAVLWLYDFDLGRDLAPPNPQIKRFLREWGHRDAALDDDANDLHAFPVASRYMHDDVAHEVARDLGHAVSAWRCQHAAWLWQTCRALLAPHRKASRLTVRRLLEFLDSEGWLPETLDDHVGDIEEVETVAQRIASFA